METALVSVFRLVLATILGGMIGLERESMNKYAGFRTHTLVCIGSCLIMITSIEMYTKIGQGINSDPARLAAQVVSGIGFLGAGTIIRSGFGVRGLTTAASLWVVAGIGLAVGAGSYITAVATTVIVFLVLVYMSGLERLVKTRKHSEKNLEVIIVDKPGQLGLVCTALGKMDVHIRNVEMKPADTEGRINLSFAIDIPYCLSMDDVLAGVKNVQGVNNAYRS